MSTPSLTTRPGPPPDAKVGQAKVAVREWVGLQAEMLASAAAEGQPAAIEVLRFAQAEPNARSGGLDLERAQLAMAKDHWSNVVFFGGADFEPPPPLGTSDRARYVKVTSLEEAQRPELRKWVEQAGSRPVGRDWHPGRTARPLVNRLGNIGSDPSAPPL